ncbi:hypothetical protein ACU4GD_37900 [Cupriavidus basilensis]
MIEKLAALPLEFSPGEAWNYFGRHRTCLRYLVGKVSGILRDLPEGAHIRSAGAWSTPPSTCRKRRLCASARATVPARARLEGDIHARAGPAGRSPHQPLPETARLHPRRAVSGVHRRATTCASHACCCKAASWTAYLLWPEDADADDRQPPTGRSGTCRACRARCSARPPTMASASDSASPPRWRRRPP